MELISSRRNLYIDSLRGLAVISVVSVHSLQIVSAGNQPPQQSTFMHFGQYGVELFFMISGWLMFMLYGRSNNFSINTFARRRLARIYPLWALFVIIGATLNYCGIAPYFGTISGNSRFSEDFSFILTILLGLSFTLWTYAPFWNSVVPGGWSIQCEIFNYVLFSMCRRIALKKIVVYMTALNVISFLFSKNNLTGEPAVISEIVEAINRLNIISSFSYFLFGILVFHFSNLIESNSNFHSLWKASKAHMPLVSVFIFSILVTPIAFGNQIHCMLYVAGSLLLCSFLTKFPNLSAPFVNFGKFSYSIYFTHFFVLSAIFRIRPRILFESQQNIGLIWIILTLFTLLTTYLIGKMSWKFFEFPLMKLLR